MTIAVIILLSSVTLLNITKAILLIAAAVVVLTKTIKKLTQGLANLRVTALTIEN